MEKLGANAPYPSPSFRGLVRTWPQKEGIAEVAGQNLLAYWIVGGDFRYKGLRLPLGTYIFYWPLVDKWHIAPGEPTTYSVSFLVERYKHLVYREPE